MSKLYIIGNGFDINHGLPCRYSDFLKYVCRYHHDDFHRIGNMFGNGNPSDLWKDFEANLATFDINRSIKNNLERFVESARHNPQFNISELTSLENGCDSLIQDISFLFRKWVHNKLVGYKVKPQYFLSPNDFYISFNYTNILERTYNIPRQRICYIHRCLCDDEITMPIFGHGLDIIGEQIKLNNTSQEIIGKINVDMEEVKNTYYKLIVDLKKDTNEGLQNLEASCFFVNTNKYIDEIIILGHSLGLSDVSYFERIAEFTNESVPITFSFFKEKEKQSIKDSIEKIFHHPERIQGERIENILKIQEQI